MSTERKLPSDQENHELSADDQQLVLIKEKAPGERRSGLDQQDPDPLDIKEEVELLNIMEGTDDTGIPFLAVPLQSEDDEKKPVLSQLPQHQVVPASSSTDQMTAATSGEDCGGAETTRNTGTLNTQEEDSSSAQTEDSEDDEEEETRSKIKDRNNKRKKRKSGVGTVKTSRKVQTRQKPYYCCDFCGKRFTRKKSLEIHTRIHTGEKPFCCHDCGKSFSNKSKLNRHTRVHTGERPLCFGDCEQNFCDKSSILDSDQDSSLSTSSVTCLPNSAQPCELFEDLDAQDSPASSIVESQLSDDDSVDDPTFVLGPEFDPKEKRGEDSDEEMEIERQDGRVENKSSWKSKSGIMWSPLPQENLHFRPAEIRRSGVTRYAMSRIENIEDCFNFFITEEIINIIIRHTNAEGIRKHKNWTEVDAMELRAFFGLLILVGVLRSRGEATYSLWGEETGRPIFRATMSLKRFRTLTATIRFEDRQTRKARQIRNPDKLAPLRDIWDRWVARLPLAYRPGEDLCVDMQVVGFRGHCSFRQFVPSKPVKYGLKMWVLCDVATTYVCGIIPYLGKKTPDAPEESGQGKQVVLELIQGRSGHTITTDKFFTSYDLGEELRKQKNCLVGMVRRTEPELPPQLLKKYGRQAFSSVFGFTPTTAAVSYMERHSRNILFLSTKHRQVEVSEERLMKPKIMLDYNRCKRAVDNLDTLISTYSCRRGTSRWPVALFNNMLDISAYNALVLWLSLNPGWGKKKLYRRRMFLQELGISLVRPAMERRKCLPRSNGAAALVLAQQESGPVQDERRIKQKCHLCPRKRSVHTRFCSNCGQGLCKEHSIFICTSCSN